MSTETMASVVDAERSIARFIRPFLFELPEDLRNARDGKDAFFAYAERIGSSALDGDKIWTEENIPTNDMLPHVAKYLGPNESKPIGRFWKFDNQFNQKHVASKHIAWRLLIPKKEEGIPFILDATATIQLALFRHGVGFLTVGAIPESALLSDWITFIHYFRFMGHRRGVGLKALKNGAAHAPFGVSLRSEDGGLCLQDLLDKVLSASGITNWDDVFTPGHSLPHVGLFARSVAEDQKPLILHRLRNFFHAGQGQNASQQDLCFQHPSLMPYAQDQWFVQTLEGGSFISFESGGALDHFQKDTLPAHMKGVYFYAGLLTLYQRFALARLSMQVAEAAGDKPGGLRWERIRNELLDFTARGLFVQAMQSDHHHGYYRKWQEVYQVPQLYDEVRNEVLDLYERETMWLRKEEDRREKEEEARESRLERAITFLGAIFVVPSLALGFMGVNIRGWTSGEGLTGITVGSILLSSMLAGAGALWWYMHRRSRHDGPGPQGS